MALVDLNVWFSLLVPEHIHHSSSAQWFRGAHVDEAKFCRSTQFGVARLLATSSAMAGKPLSVRDAWWTIQRLMEDERVGFLHEPRGFEAIVASLLNQPTASPKLVGDAYLAAYALASGESLVTFDRGFAQFEGLRVVLLSDRP